ncbi:MAG: patatin-like phospholipase family protein [Candidatus Omnitrophica bacterium]|nr:patatin-like phospholipase family protein [Candidatus Omnitrophota bacterium]
MPDATYLTNKLSILDSLPLFLDLSHLEKKLIASKLELVEFERGKIIYKKADPPDYFYCMVSGRVEIYHAAAKTRKPQDVIIEHVRRGDYFGSISSLTGQPHTVSARTLNDCLLLRIVRKDFKYILRKVPKFGSFLSRSLSRRIRQKTFKEIFESTIIAIYTLESAKNASSYVQDLAKSLRRESGKNVLILKSTSILNKGDVALRLSSFSEEYHYVLVDISGKVNDINLEIFKQSNICHILSASDGASLTKVSTLVKRLERLFAKYRKQSAYIILKQDGFYAETPYAYKLKILSKDIFATLPQDRQNYKKTIRRIAREISQVAVGLVLGSGGAMGLAHIGVLKVLKDEKIPIDIISATSIGAVIASFWSVGFSTSEIEKLFLSFKSKLRTLLLVDPTLPIKGLIKGRAVKRILKSYLGNKTFSDTKIPLKIVACDIKKRREFVIDKGKLLDAVMASIAIPGVFEPVRYNSDIQLVDGGIVNPLPVSVLSKIGIKRIIAVNTLPSPHDIVRLEQKRLNIYNIIVNSFHAMEYSMAINSRQQADVYIHPIPKLADWYEFYKARLFIKTGQEHARRKLIEIKKLLRR